MIKLSISSLEEASRKRPEGYLQEVMAAGRVEAGFLWLSDEDYAALRARFSGADAVTPAAIKAKARYAICKSCVNSENNAFGCKLHKGCCFGRWRSQPESRCYLGKW